MKILVMGGTGTVGSQVVRELQARKHSVRVLTRDKSKVPPGVEAAVGNLTDPYALGPAFEGVDAVFMLNGLSMTETHEGMMGLSAARAAGAKKLVYMSVHQLDHEPLIPHFAAKVPIEIALKNSGIPFSILRPNNFHQNDQWFKDVILQHGVYPQPLGDRGVSRVDVRDIAEAAAITLTQPGHEGQTYDLVGPRAWTGTATAQAWSEALGRPIAYGGNDLDAWEKVNLQYMPAWLVYDFKIMYRWFQTQGFLGTAADVERLTKLLGHAPRSFEDYARETAAQWSTAAVSR